MNKIIEVIFNILTLGFYAWKKYKKHEPKITALYVGIADIMKDTNRSDEKIKEILKKVQENYGVLNEVGRDLTKLYVKGILKK